MSALNQEEAPGSNDARYWKQLQNCPLCGSSSISACMLAPDRHYGNPGIFSIAECKSCGLNFLNPMPTPEYLSGAYPDNYYAYQAPASNSSKARALRLIKKIVRAIFFYHPATTHDPKFETCGSMLDFGCGAGDFIAEMRQKGWDVHGVDFDVKAAERGRQAGLDIFGGTINDANFPAASFDYVRSNHSFEHIEDPRDVLREMRRVIKPGGVLFIGVPNVAGFFARQFGPYWWFRGAPVHTFGYSPSTLTRLLSEEGFKVTRVQYHSSLAGVLGSLQIYLNRNNGKSSEDGWVIRNPLLKLYSQWLGRFMDLLQMGDCIEVIAKPK